MTLFSLFKLVESPLSPGFWNFTSMCTGWATFTHWPTHMMGPFNLEICFYSLRNFSWIISLMISSPLFLEWLLFRCYSFWTIPPAVLFSFLFFIVLSFGSISGKYWVFHFCYMFVCLFVLKAYFCSLSSKIASYSCFMGAISSLILENKFRFLPSGLFLCLFWLLVCLFICFCYYFFLLLLLAVFLRYLVTCSRSYWDLTHTPAAASVGY